MKKKSVLKEDTQFFTSFDEKVYEGLIINAEYFDMIQDPIKRDYLLGYVYEFGENFVIEQLLKGAEVEKNHSSNFNEALQIAVDHLVDSIYFYIELEKMENNLFLMEQTSLEEGIDFKSPSHKFLYPESVKSLIKDFSCTWILETIEKHWREIKGFEDFCLVYIEKEKNTFIFSVVDYPDSKSPIAIEDLGFTSLPFSILFYMVDGYLLFPSDYFVGV
jgi:hypothetical protein